MPVFGKGRTERQRTQFLEKTVKRTNNGKHSYERREHYHWENTSLFLTEFWLRFRITNFVRQRFKKLRRPIVVLDWGCGKGRAIERLATKQGPRVNAIGYSKDSYSEWQNVQKARIIHETPAGLTRYIKDNSIDLLYSSLGLSNFLGYEKTRDLQYLHKLAKKLTVGGVLITDYPEHISGGLSQQAIQTELGDNWRVETEKSKILEWRTYLKITRAG